MEVFEELEKLRVEQLRICEKIEATKTIVEELMQDKILGSNCPHCGDKEMTKFEKLWEKIIADVIKDWEEKAKKLKKVHIPDETPEHCPHCSRCSHCGQKEPISPDFHISYF